MNETIANARQVALDILKPAPGELEHGLELHRDSVVFESYGFAPRAAIDGDVMRAAVEGGASDIEVRDLNEDMRMTRYVTDADERAEFAESFDAAGVTCIFQNAGEEGQDVPRLIKRLARFTFATDMMPDFLRKAVTPDDIVTAQRESRHCLYFSANGVPLTQAWESVEDELRYVTILFRFGIRMMHLTYNRRNMIGDGCAEPANGGLSDFGRTVIAEMNRVGLVVDIAHSGWQTSLEAAQTSAKPMVASHTVCAALNPHCRSKPDEVIRAIADTGGTVGICCIPAFLGGTGDIRAFLDHIDHVVKTVGIDHVTIGTDVAYTSSASAQEQRKVPARGRSRRSWRNFWPPDDPLSAPEWRKPEQVQSLAWTNWPMFTVGMVQRGYSDDDIRKILGENMLRVARDVLQ